MLNFPHQYLGSMYLETNNKQLADIEVIHRANLENLEEIARIQLQLFNSHTIVGVTIASITLFPFDCSLCVFVKHQTIRQKANTATRAVLRKSSSSNTTRTMLDILNEIEEILRWNECGSRLQ